jgi:hypothetical protein
MDKKLSSIVIIPLMLLLLTLLFVSCGGNTSQDKVAIEQVIRGYVSSYNASNFEDTLACFTGYDDYQDALAYLVFLRSLSGEITLVNFDAASISVTGNTARVPVDFIIMNELSSQWINLEKVNGNWKILWEQ